MELISKCICGEEAKLFTLKGIFVTDYQVCCTVCDQAGSIDIDKLGALQHWEEHISELNDTLDIP